MERGWEESRQTSHSCYTFIISQGNGMIKALIRRRRRNDACNQPGTGWEGKTKGNLVMKQLHQSFEQWKSAREE
jgi:hypothetical protein